MPTNTKHKKTKPKKSFKKKTVTKKSNVVNRPMVSLGQGLPKKLLVTHKYSEIVVPTATSGVMQKYSFSCNGMFDPNITGTGHQPMYFDQMAALYDHYRVIGSICTFKITHLVTSNYAAVVGAFVNDDSTTTPTTSFELMENSLSKHRMLAAGQLIPAIFTLKWSAKKYFGGSVLSNPELQGTAAANPTEQSMFTIFVQPIDQISSNSYNVEVDIKYIAVWTELKDIAGS